MEAVCNMLIILHYFSSYSFGTGIAHRKSNNGKKETGDIRMKQNLNRYREVKSGNEGNLAKRGETGCKIGNQLFKDKRRIKMRKLFVVLMAMGLCLGFTGMAMAGPQSQQTSPVCKDDRFA